MASFGARLTKRRAVFGLTQTQLAKAVGVTTAAVSLFESDNRSPSIQTLRRLCQCLRVSSDELLGLDGPQNATAIEQCEQLLATLQGRS